MASYYFHMDMFPTIMNCIERGEYIGIYTLRRNPQQNLSDTTPVAHDHKTLFQVTATFSILLLNSLPLFCSLGKFTMFSYWFSFFLVFQAISHLLELVFSACLVLLRVSLQSLHQQEQMALVVLRREQGRWFQTGFLFWKTFLLFWRRRFQWWVLKLSLPASLLEQVSLSRYLPSMSNQ